MSDHMGEGSEMGDMPDGSLDARRQQRIEALRALAGQQQAQKETAPTRNVPPGMPNRVRPTARKMVTRRTRGLWVAGAALAICLVVVGVLVSSRVTRPTAQTHALPDPFTMSFTQGDIQCPREAAWSPDGTRVAVLGYHRACEGVPTAGNVPNNGYVTLYSTTTWTVVRSVALDAPVLSEVATASAAGAQPAAASTSPNAVVVNASYSFSARNRSAGDEAGAGERCVGC